MSNINDFIIENGVLKEYVGNDEEVIIPEGIVRIGEGAFYGREDIVSVTIPDGVTSIGEKSFFGCVLLTDITIPDSVTEIGDSAFWGCESLNVAIPDSVITIGEGAFGCCDELADEDGFVIIRGVLYYYSGDSIDVVIPEGVTRIEIEAFALQEDLESVVIPASVTDIGCNAFSSECVTICAPKGSCAEAYAKENNIPFAEE